MNKKLLILRHAKSDWGADYSRDRERPLIKRGTNDAQLIGEWMVSQQLVPDLILCSPAKRARSTLGYALNSFGNLDIKTLFLEEIYLADTETLLETIRSVPDTTQCLLLVGHNPGLEDLVLYLSKKRPPLTESGKLFTTANLAVFELDSSYSQLKQHGARLETLLRPADLRDD